MPASRLAEALSSRGAVLEGQRPLLQMEQISMLLLDLFLL